MKQRFISILDMSKKRQGLTVICIIILISFITGSLIACSKVNQLNNDEGISLKEPPELTVTVGKKSITAVLGTYSWNIDNGDGTGTGIEADSGLPSELVKYQKESLIIEPKSLIVLDFKNMPNDYIVSIWEEDNPITQQVNDGMIIAPQKKGLVVYGVHARWKQGNAYYAFSVNVE